jgi:hypothetical protein
VIPPEHNTAQGEFNRSLEEVAELGAEIDRSDGSRESNQQIAEEATDVIVRMLGVIASVHGNIAELLPEKIGVLEQKYNPIEHRRLRREGLTFPDAMAAQKARWTARRTPRALPHLPHDAA